MFMEKFNWKLFCLVGLICCAVFIVWHLFNGNMIGARIQFIVGLAYAAGLTYLSLKKKE